MRWIGYCARITIYLGKFFREFGTEGEDMVHKLSLALALAIGVTPFCVTALGLGDIHLKSALNDYFSADINLLSVAADEISDVRVELASSDAFQRAGIDRPFALTKLRFKPVELPDGTSVVQVTSRDPIREPFLNFLIEVNWPKGKIVREYTVLLDPPVTLDGHPVLVQSAQASMHSSATSSNTVGQSLVQPSDVSWAGGGAASEYGPTKRNDTLWSIAKKVRHQGVTMNQAMMSLLQANPQAFIKQNINNLKVGQILRVADSEEMMPLGTKEAGSAYREQVYAWQADRKPAAASVAEPEITAQAAVTQVEAESDVLTAELKIVSARPEGEDEAGAGDDEQNKAQTVDRLAQDLIIAQEATDSAIQEGEELRSRVGDLEAQLNDLRRLLTLKDDQLARLQVALVDGIEELDEGAQVVPKSEGEEVVTAEKVVAEEIAAAKEEASVSQAIIKPVAAIEPSKQQMQPSLMDKEKSLFERISGDATMLGVSLTSIVVVVVLLWVVISRRRSNSANFQESILVSGMEDSEAEPMEGVPTGTTTQIAEETSFLSDFSPSDIGALQDETGEVDSLAEADVYIAYGRYQQAEKLIKQAIERNPERVELKHKLFEILFAVKDSDSFVALAEQSVAEGINKSDADIWLKVVAMGAQLASSHALFSGVDAPAPVNNGQVDAELNALEEDLGLGDGLDFDLPAETAAEDELGSFTLDDLNGFKEDALAPDSGGDDLDLGVDNLTLPEADTSETAASGELEDTILDFSDVAETAGTGDQADDSFDGLGLNLDAGEAATDLETSLSLSDVEEFESTSLSTGETDEIVDEVNTKLDLARAYVDLGDVEGARSILEEVLGEGNQGQQQEAQQLLDQLT